MRVSRLEDFTGGWFVGDFSPAALRTDAAEVGVKRYKAGETNPLHRHKLGTEATLVLEGTCQMGDNFYREGDILVLEPGEASDFRAITDCTCVVFKTPSVPGDKYPGEAQ